MSMTLNPEEGITFQNGSSQQFAAVKPNLLVDPTLRITQAGFAGGAVTAGQYGPDIWFTRSAASNATLNYSGDTKTLTGELSTWLFNDKLQGQKVTVAFLNQVNAATVTIDGTSEVINPGQTATFDIGGAASFPLEFRIEGTGLEFDEVGCVKGEAFGSFGEVYDPEAFYLDRVLSWFEQVNRESNNQMIALGQPESTNDARFVYFTTKRMAGLPILSASGASDFFTQETFGAGTDTVSNISFGTSSGRREVVINVDVAATPYVNQDNLELRMNAGAWLRFDARPSVP